MDVNRGNHVLEHLRTSLQSSVIADRSRAPRWYKIVFSVVSGILGLFLYRFSLSFLVETVVISITWAQLFPILSSIAFGPAYGFLAGISGGAWFPFLLWANNGWANVLTFVLALSTYTLFGWARNGRIPRAVFGPARLPLALALAIGLHWVGFTFFFNPLLSLNPTFPPFWYFSTISSLPPEILFNFVIKDGFNLAFLVTSSSILLRIPTVRRIFHMKNYRYNQYNRTIAIISLGVGIVIWSGYYLLVKLLIHSHNDGSYISLGFLIIVLGSLLAARVIIFSQENQNKTSLALRRSENRLQELVQEKNVLLRELYHRTKNNMQTISSLLSLKAGEKDSPEIQALLIDVNTMIQSMSLVHTHLYESRNLAYIDMENFIPDLASLVQRSFPPNTSFVEFEFFLEPVRLSIESAMPCAMVLNELITNSFKYAVLPGRNTRISLGLSQPEPERILLSLKDNGPGLPEGFDLGTTKTFGLITAQSMVESQLGGSMEITSSPQGLEYTILW